MRKVITNIVGEWTLYKYRTRAIQTGDYGAVARQLRKQGVPFAIAKMILLGR